MAKENLLERTIPFDIKWFNEVIINIWELNYYTLAFKISATLWAEQNKIKNP